MKLYVVRHAHAGSRSAWSGDDRLRPLSKKGRRQAEALRQALADAGITRVMSSPSVRCIETMRPLTDVLGLPLDTDARLAEGSTGDAALELVGELRHQGESTAAICSHGDVIPELLTRLKLAGTSFHQPLTWPKGSVWALSGNGRHWTDAQLLELSPAH